MRVLIADDHELVRDTIAAFLEQEDGLEVVRAECLPSAEGRLQAEGPFDLVLLDYDMPGMNGLDGLRGALALNAGRPVALMSGVARRAEAEAALAMGAGGFLPKSMAARSLVNAVRLMASGEPFAPIDFMTAGAEDAPLDPAGREDLSPRERQVLEALCRGLSNKEIARELALQEVTVKLHVRTACRKLGARNRTQAALMAKEAGLV